MLRCAQHDRRASITRRAYESGSGEQRSAGFSMRGHPAGGSLHSVDLRMGEVHVPIKIPARLIEPGGVVYGLLADAAGGEAALLQVLLVIVFGDVELARRGDLGGDRAAV